MFLNSGRVVRTLLIVGYLRHRIARARRRASSRSFASSNPLRRVSGDRMAPFVGERQEFDGQLCRGFELRGDGLEADEVVGVDEELQGVWTNPALRERHKDRSYIKSESTAQRSGAVMTSDDRDKWFE